MARYPIDLEWLTNIIHETGLEFMTSSIDLKNTWQMIADRYCEERGLDPIPYKAFSKKWQNAKFYSKKLAKMGLEPRKSGISRQHNPELIPSDDEFDNLSFDKTGQPSIVSFQSLSAASQKPEAGPPAAKKLKLGSKGSSALDLVLKREEHSAKVDEIRQRMEQEQELFQLRKEKIESELERERVQLERERVQLEREKVELRISRERLAKLTGNPVQDDEAESV